MRGVIRSAWGSNGRAGVQRLTNLTDPCAVQRVAQQQVQLSTGGGAAAPLAQQLERPPINQRGGHEVFTFDLGDARLVSGLTYNARGFGLLYSIQASVQGGVLDFDFDGGGIAPQCIPGAKFRGNFSRFTVRLNPASITAGLVTLRVWNQPDVDFTELARGYPAGTLGNPALAGSGPNGAATQTYNSAVGNFPVLATDGLALNGASGVRASVEASDGSVITACTLQWWQFCSAAGVGHKWGMTDMIDTFAGLATATWFPLDKQVWVPEGRVYAEARNFTTISGVSVPIVRLNTWGN